MEHQGKSKKQYTDSAKLAAFGIIGGVITLVSLIVYNILVHGIGSY